MLSKSRIILLILAAVVFSSCAPDPVVATVNGKKITVSDLKSEMAMERGKFDPAILSSKVNFEKFRDGALKKIIDENILLSEASKKGISLSKDEKSVKRDDILLTKSLGIKVKNWEKAQKNRLLIQKLIEKEVFDKIPIGEDKIEAYYKSHIKEFNLPLQYRARQIIVDNRALAEEILAKIKKGEKFEDLAKEHSLSPDGKRGGDLGFFDPSTFPEIFSEVCGKLKVGEVSEVVQTDYGYQIFELLDKKPARQAPFNEAKDKIKRLLQEEKSEKTFQEWSKNLTENAKTVVNEEILKGVEIETAK